MKKIFLKSMLVLVLFFSFSTVNAKSSNVDYKIAESSIAAFSVVHVVPVFVDGTFIGNLCFHDDGSVTFNPA